MQKDSVRVLKNVVIEWILYQIEAAIIQTL